MNAKYTEIGVWCIGKDRFFMTKVMSSSIAHSPSPAHNKKSNYETRDDSDCQNVLVYE